MTHTLITLTSTPKTLRFYVAKVLMAAAVTVGVCSTPLHAAEQEWWFDVEVIVFERTLDPSNIAEKFEQSSLVPPADTHIDLLTPYIQPDISYLLAGLPYCRASNRLAVEQQYAKDFAFPEPVAKPPEELTEETPEQSTDSETESVQAETIEEDFQYQVATSDIFAETDDPLDAPESTDTQIAISEEPSENALQESVKPRPPIQVELLEWQLPSVFPCAYSEQIDPLLKLSEPSKDITPNISPLAKQVPVEVNGIEWQKKRGAFLLPSSLNHMNDLYEAISKQRDIKPILHANWRQEVKFGRDKAQTFRLFAGQNYAEAFDANGQPVIDDTDSLFDSLAEHQYQNYVPEAELAKLSPEERQTMLSALNGESTPSDEPDLFAQIDQALADDSPLDLSTLHSTQATYNEAERLDNIWQLDGGITVYLRYVGRVPYLHIDSKLDFRYPLITDETSAELNTNIALDNAQSELPPKQLNTLQSVTFDQLRRVISKQVHYFDHPLFGMVVRINRYRWPEVESEDSIE